MNILMKISGDLNKWAAEEQARIDKALTGALYDATYQLYKQSRDGLKSGNLGLPERVALRNIKSARKEIKGRNISSVKLRGGAAAKIPLKSLTGGVLYKVNKAAKSAEIGFIGQEGGAKRIAQWAEELAGRHYQGYALLYDEALREKLHGFGIHLRKDTRSVNVSARPIASQMRVKYGAQALEKLADSFDRKMAGERT